MNHLTGSVKVAILTKVVGMAAARPILERLSDQERNLIFKLQSKLDAIPPELAENVAREFLQNTGALIASNKADGRAARLSRQRRRAYRKNQARA
jgi:flagellar motor switch protein FliG